MNKQEEAYPKLVMMVEDLRDVVEVLLLDKEGCYLEKKVLKDANKLLGNLGEL